jgi:hypothetical protein
MKFIRLTAFAALIPPSISAGVGSAALIANANGNHRDQTQSSKIAENPRNGTRNSGTTQCPRADSMAAVT